MTPAPLPGHPGHDRLHLQFSKVQEKAGVKSELWYTATGRITSCEVHSNAGNGIQVGAGSSLRISLSKVYGNGWSGIGTTQMSTVALRGGSSIYSNGDNSGWRGGIGAHIGSVVVFTLEDTNVRDKIYNNRGPGLFIGNNGAILVKAGEVTSNQGNGVTLNLGSTGQFEDGASITSNTGYGVGCTWNSTVTLTPGVDLTGNTLGPSNCL